MQNEIGEFLYKDWDTVIKAVNALPEKYSKITYEDVERLNWFVDTMVTNHLGSSGDEKLDSKLRKIKDNYYGALLSRLDGIEV